MLNFKHADPLAVGILAILGLVLMSSFATVVGVVVAVWGFCCSIIRRLRVH